MPLRRGKLHLRSRHAIAAERLDDRQTEAAREIQRLIEPALSTPAGMERHRDDDVRVAQEVGTRDPHSYRQRAPDGSPALILERVDDLAQRAVVEADGAPAIDGVSPAPAAGALRLDLIERAPRRQRIAARFADRRCDRTDGLPAGGAHGTSRWTIEEACAAGAGRSEENRNQGVDRGRGDPIVYERDQPGSVIGSALPQSRSSP